MEKNQNLFQELPAEERAKALADNCFAQEEKIVPRYFSPEQVDGLKNELSTFSIELRDKRIKLDEVSKPIKADIKGLELEVAERVKKLKTRCTEDEETIYMMDDQAAGMMLEYDKFGEFLGSRKLLPSERQTSIVREIGTGTNG